MGSNGSFSKVILNKENASKIWRLIQQTGEELLGKLPDHPDHQKGRNPYAHVALEAVSYTHLTLPTILRV